MIHRYPRPKWYVVQTGRVTGIASPHWILTSYYAVYSRNEMLGYISATKWPASPAITVYEVFYLNAEGCPAWDAPNKEFGVIKSMSAALEFLSQITHGPSHSVHADDIITVCPNKADTHIPMTYAH